MRAALEAAGYVTRDGSNFAQDATYRTVDDRKKVAAAIETAAAALRA
jgi:hypothetical protein